MQADETPEDRLEAALERIARGIAASDPKADEVAERVDRIISRVRSVLGEGQKS